MPKKKIARPRVRKNASEKSEFLVVGVGASAGGLKPLKDLLLSLPANPRLALVIVQHLSPEHKSSLPEILSRTTKLPVQTAEDGMKIQANRVYVLAENASITLTDGTLHIGKRMMTDGSHHPINRFFTSLGEHCKSRCAGVVLSGAASDGSDGLKAIKAEGGITFAQDPQTAIHSGMPQSAIDRGGVDFILPVEKIAEELVRIAHHTYTNGAAAQLSHETRLAKDDPATIFRLLRDATGVDFGAYKYTTIDRRFKRRMAMLRVETLEDYGKFLAKDPAELRALYEDIFVHVTHFFRNPGRFDALKEKIYGEIITHRAHDVPVRIWVPGCSTGEEAYSIIIAWLEYIESASLNVPLQIFATDISEDSIRRAREGCYQKNIEEHVSGERLERFFETYDRGYKIKKSIRQLCVFARHDVLRNPFFAKLDLISCSNVLIYLARAAQKRTLSVYHHALNPKGFLMLGKSESTTVVSGLFRTVDQKNRIFARKQVTSPNILPLHGVASNIESRSEANKDRPNGFDLQKEADRIVLSHHAPRGFLLDDKLNIVQFRGRLSPFLEPAGREASLNIMNMIQKELQWEIRVLIREAKKKSAPAGKKNLEVRFDDESERIDLEVIPIRNKPNADLFFLVLLKDARHNPEEPKGRQKGAGGKDPVAAQLKRELEHTTRKMQSLLEEQEEVNRELSAANEALQSSNQELESTNEELETTKEEMESTNEELNTLNEELHHRNEDLNELNRTLAAERNYSRSLISTVREPLVVLDDHLRVINANQAFYEMFKETLNKTEHSMIYDLGSRQWDIPDLRDALENVIREKRSFEDYQVDATFPHIGRRTISLNARRVRQEKGEDMILLAMEDITHRKHAEEAANILVKEIHHRIKNNLQVISSLLSLQSRFAKDEKSYGLLRESENRIRSMSLIHEKLYQTSEAASLFFRDYVIDLLDSLFAFYNVDRDRVRPQVDVGEFYLNMDLAVPCGLIINELLSNALKYAFPEERKGTIEIHMRQKKSKKSSTFVLRVKDNGVGLPKSFDPQKKPRTLGMQIVTALSRQIDGELQLDRKRGTSFSITFVVKSKPTPVSLPETPLSV